MYAIFFLIALFFAPPAILLATSALADRAETNREINLTFVLGFAALAILALILILLPSPASV